MLYCNLEILFFVLSRWKDLWVLVGKFPRTSLTWISSLPPNIHMTARYLRPIQQFFKQVRQQETKFEIWDCGCSATLKPDDGTLPKVGISYHNFAHQWSLFCKSSMGWIALW